MREKLEDLIIDHPVWSALVVILGSPVIVPLVILALAVALIMTLILLILEVFDA